MHVPPSLQTDDLSTAINLVGAYYAARFDDFPKRGDSPPFFRGAFFDNCSTDPEDADFFTPADLLSLPMLSIGLGQYRTVPEVLYYRHPQYSELLKGIGPDRDLADEPGPLPAHWPARRLEKALCEIRGVSKVTATKLIARKRPRLFPIFDRVVKSRLAPDTVFLDTVHAELSTNETLRTRINEVRNGAELPNSISALRILDVVSWMEGQHPEWRTYTAPTADRNFMTQ
ncbi:MAG: DUF6308 family protein [Corynebacterium variabile]|uniref:DUF6308 family protein n=1 Tax=Corynebacterium variabile TaxID=1727 RepID=UPI003F918B99